MAKRHGMRKRCPRCQGELTFVSTVSPDGRVREGWAHIVSLSALFQGQNLCDFFLAQDRVVSQANTIIKER